MKKVSILGATGSIGTSTVDVLNQYRDKFSIKAVTAFSNVQKLADIAQKTNAEVAVIGNPKLLEPLREALRVRQLKTIAKAGEKAIVEELLLVQLSERPALLLLLLLQRPAKDFCLQIKKALSVAADF